MAASGSEAATSPTSQAARQAAKALLEAAKAGLGQLAKKAEARDVDLGDLACAQCGSLLFEPTTLEDGVTVCQPCVRKWREARSSGPAAEGLPSWALAPEAFGFGQSPSVVLTDLTQRCSPAAHAAAAARQKANAFFGKGQLAEAAAAYSDAIAGSPCADVALHCNRSVTRLKLGEVAGALEDAERAVALCRRTAPAGGPSCPMWAKAWFRLGQALLAASGRGEEAAFALAMSAAGSPGQALLPQLVDATSALLRLDADADASAGAAASGVALEKVRSWLSEGSCPSLETAAPAEEEPASLQLSLSSPDGTADSAHEEWVSQQLECALCLGLLFEPSTVPCGHTLCRPCLARSLDHAFEAAPACPMCRRDLAPYLTWINARAVVAAKASGGLVGGHGAARIPVSRTLDRILQRHFQAETEARRAQIAREEAAAGDVGGAREGAVVPIFICSLAMPAVACNLHIFEPRYRLMMRRCLESGQRQFGMCLTPESEYGAMLHISGFEQLPDGRSRVQSTGTRRFRVLEWGEKDGYATGRIAWVDDDSEAAAEGCDEEDGLQEDISPTLFKLKCVVQGVLNFALGVSPAEENWREHGRPKALEKIELQLGAMPEADCRSGRYCPAYVFWCINLASAMLGLPTESAYELCYGAEYRASPAKRAAAILEFFQQRVSSPEAVSHYHARTGKEGPQEPPPCVSQ